MRPRGEISGALLSAASQAPGSVPDLAARAQVGLASARYTASRMIDRGELVVLGEGRPAVLGVPQRARDALAEKVHALHRALFSRRPSDSPSTLSFADL